MAITLYDYCIERSKTELLSQWDEEKNGELTPRDLTYGSHKKVWWKCEKGHQWEAAVYTRGITDKGCPVCRGKVIIAGETDLASQDPEIAAQWHPTKNGDLTPEDVTRYSNKKVWWICDKGHEYLSSVSHRTKERSECPYCKGKKVLTGFNDLATREPELAKEWHPELNGELTPQMVTAGSKHRVWWQCSEGHVWKAVVYSRTARKRSGCPVCAGVVRKEKQRRYL